MTTKRMGFACPHFEYDNEEGCAHPDNGGTCTAHDCPRAGTQWLESYGPIWHEFHVWNFSIMAAGARGYRWHSSRYAVYSEVWRRLGPEATPEQMRQTMALLMEELSDDLA